MSKFSLIKASHNGTYPVLFARNLETGQATSFTMPFSPYFYVEDMKGSYISVDGKKLRKVTCERPGDVPTERSKYSATWEADIPYARRYLIDKGIRSGFEVLGAEVKPIDVEYTPDIIYIDIESYPAGNEPNEQKDYITCVSLTSNKMDDVATLLNGIEAKDEKELLGKLVYILNGSKPDILCGYGDYDYKMLSARFHRYNIEFSFDSINYFDFLSAIRTLTSRVSYRLKDVALEEGVTTEKQPQLNYRDLYDNNKPELKRINTSHVRWLRDLDKKLNVCNYFWEIKSFVGLENIERTIYASTLIDTLLLREYKDKYVLPSKEKHERVPYEGAIILKPKRSIYRGIAVLDMAAYYPHVILDEKLDPTIWYAYHAWKKSGKTIGEFLDGMQNM